MPGFFFLLFIFFFFLIPVDRSFTLISFSLSHHVFDEAVISLWTSGSCCDYKKTWQAAIAVVAAAAAATSLEFHGEGGGGRGAHVADMAHVVGRGRGMVVGKGWVVHKGCSRGVAERLGEGRHGGRGCHFNLLLAHDVVLLLQCSSLLGSTVLEPDLHL